ncbi:MAG: hypothetical protein WCT01_02105 [Candidatus Shapirobacteria bacterium]
MEKIVIFIPIILFFGLFLVLILVFLGFVIRLISRSKSESWSGVITDKQHTTSHNSDTDHLDHFYFLVVKQDGGRERKVGLSSQIWDQFSVGDKITKPSGQLFPHKVSS